ncbi:MAG: hypothetical protein ACJ77N_12355 [Chloroflexota bacterium]
MTDLHERARVAAEQLQDVDDDELYQQLGLRIRAIERDPSIAGDLSPDVPATEMGISFVDLREFGRRTFVTLSAPAMGVVCAGAGEGHSLEALLRSFGTSGTAVTAALTTVLIGQLAIAPAVAGIVATLVVGKVAPATLQGLCGGWGRKLEQARAAAPQAPATSDPAPGDGQTTGPSGATSGGKS